MTLVAADVPMSAVKPLALPHSSRCVNPDHPTTHCYREAELETRVVDFLRASYPRVSVYRQLIWKGIGRPDIVCTATIGDVIHVTIIELKVVPIREREFSQLARYVHKASNFWAKRDESFVVTGILAGFSIRDYVFANAPEWFGFWQMDLAS